MQRVILTVAVGLAMLAAVGGAPRYPTIAQDENRATRIAELRTRVASLETRVAALEANAARVVPLATPARVATEVPSACAAYRSQAEAQEALMTGLVTSIFVEQVDPDGNGAACERHAYRAAPAPTRRPLPGAATSTSASAFGAAYGAPTPTRVGVEPWTPPAGVWVVPDVLDCSDFTSRLDANVAYIASGGPTRDPHNLDEDRDGFACEMLP